MDKDVKKTIWRRVLIIAISLLVSFIFPAVLIVTAFLAWTIYEDLKTSSRPSPPPPITWKTVTPEDSNWLEFFCDRCESPAEEKFLLAMVKDFSLEPCSGILKSQGLTLDMQVKVANYRFDFLVNDRLVVEIDGAAYHSTSEQIERDRIRDEYSVRIGYDVLRIPAKVVFNTPNEATHHVRTALTKSQSNKTSPEPKNVIYKNNNEVNLEISKQVAEPKTIGQHIAAFSEGLDKIDRTVTALHKAEKATKNFKLAIETEKSQLIHIMKLAELDQSIEEMPPKLREIYNETAVKFGRDNSSSELSFDWMDLTKPDCVEDEEVQRKVDVIFNLAMEKREAQLNQLRERCEKDPLFKKIFCKKLAESKYPLERSFRIVPNVLYFNSGPTNLNDLFGFTVKKTNGPPPFS